MNTTTGTKGLTEESHIGGFHGALCGARDVRWLAFWRKNEATCADCVAAYESGVGPHRLPRTEVEHVDL